MKQAERYWTGDAGAVTVDWVLIAAGCMGLLLATMGVVSKGAEKTASTMNQTLSNGYITFQSRNLGRTPQEAAALMEMEHFSQAFSVRQVTKLLEDKTDTQLERGHRRWVERAADPAYDTPAKARDQVRLFELAMEVRGVASIVE